MNRSPGYLDRFTNIHMGDIYTAILTTKLKTARPLDSSVIFVLRSQLSADTSAPLGLDILDLEFFPPCTVYNRVVERIRNPKLYGTHNYVDEWFIQLKRSAKSHFYASMHILTPIYFSKMQLPRLHRQFFFLSASKQFNFIKRSRTVEAMPETLKVLEDISIILGHY